ncbi:MAG TPA: hypothetical protein VG389_27250 [Myxococcota bacterium]|jgi:tetratricopeptide (TPR) repeat protein|nr:hypothetical protein [Myxococcota bacterium]
MDARLIAGTIAAAGLLAGAPPALAALEQVHRVDVAAPAAREAARLSTDSADALMHGDYAQALALAERGVAEAPADPWPQYLRGAALTRLMRTDEAVVAFQRAEAQFTADDMWGRSVATYGRAHVLDASGRCAEAGAAYRDYAALVQPHDAALAEMALRYASYCKAPAAASPPARP